jgi:hypothetical protein
MTVKTEHYLFGLIGVGTVIVLYLLFKESQPSASASASVAPVAENTVPSYPAPPAPINLGDVNLSQTPPYQNYNLSGSQNPTVRVGTSHSDCGCDDNDCDTAGLPVTVQTISDDVLSAATKNYQSFASKVSKPVSGVEKARIVLQQA